jgi:hypothetical protein
MLGTHPALVSIGALLATEATAASDGISLGQILPVVIGAVFTLGVVVVGLLMSRSKSAGTVQAPTESAQQPLVAPAQGETGQPQPPDAVVLPVRNPLWGLIVPGVGVLLLGGAIFGVVIPFLQDVSTAHDNFRATIRPPSFNITVPPQPFLPPQVPLPPPQIQIPHIQPTISPPPRIPQPYIDGRGGVRMR